MTLRPLLFPALIAAQMSAHAPITPAIRGPLRARGAVLVDSAGEVTALRGVTLPGLDVLDPAPGSADAESAAAMTSATFGVIRVRWNMNAVRLPVSVAAWRRDGQRYLDRVETIVRLANENALVVILAAREDGRSGSAGPTGLPGADTLAFWREWAARFRDNPRVVFSVFRHPSTRNVPGAAQGIRSANDWAFWLNGGMLPGGPRAAGMQELVNVIRSTGAQQLIAVPAFHDALGFEGLSAELQVRDANILYEAHPAYEFGISDAARTTIFGSVASRAPVYAGEWGFETAGGAGCAALPRDPPAAMDAVFATAQYFDSRNISWTAASMQRGGLVGDFVDYLPTVLDRPFTCGEIATPQPGMGEALLLVTTGDAQGFGSLRAQQIANAAGGPASPVAPGQLLSIYIEQLGPSPGQNAVFDSSGKLPVSLGGTRVLFDGAPAPLLHAGGFQVNLQVPYYLEPGKETTIQVFYDHVPSNRLRVPVVEAAPELFSSFGQFAIALNQDGSPNGPSNPAPLGTIVTLFGSGGGQTEPGGIAGIPALIPHPRLTLPVMFFVDSQQADVLFAGETPGFTGLAQFNIRVPASLVPAPSRRAVPVELRVGQRSSQARVFLWIL